LRGTGIRGHPNSGLSCRRSTYCALLFAAALAGAASPAAAASLEYRVKAACLCNFLKFVEWPPRAFSAPDSPFALCVLGQDPFGSDLDDIAAAASVGRRLVVRRVGDVKSAAACHVVYVSDSERGHLSDIVQALAPAPVLTVSDDQAFTQLGGQLRFFLAENKVRFEINLPALERAGLKASAKLLSLARVVGKPGGR
jgi:hypothetical protein